MLEECEVLSRKFEEVRGGAPRGMFGGVRRGSPLEGGGSSECTCFFLT